jgi:hypothetical protein
MACHFSRTSKQDRWRSVALAVGDHGCGQAGSACGKKDGLLTARHFSNLGKCKDLKFIVA